METVQLTIWCTFITRSATPGKRVWVVVMDAASFQGVGHALIDEEALSSVEHFEFYLECEGELELLVSFSISHRGSGLSNITEGRH